LGLLGPIFQKGNVHAETYKNGGGGKKRGAKICWRHRKKTPPPPPPPPLQKKPDHPPTQKTNPNPPPRLMKGGKKGGGIRHRLNRSERGKERVDPCGGLSVGIEKKKKRDKAVLSASGEKKEKEIHKAVLGRKPSCERPSKKSSGPGHLLSTKKRKKKGNRDPSFDGDRGFK